MHSGAKICFLKPCLCKVHLESTKFVELRQIAQNLGNNLAMSATPVARCRGQRNGREVKGRWLLLFSFHPVVPLALEIG